MIRLSTVIGGSSEIGVRWLNAVLGVGCVILIFIAGTRLFSWKTGLIAAAILAVAPPYLVVSRFVYTDTLPCFLLLLSLTLLTPVFLTSALHPVEMPPWRWVLTGVTWALLFNTKLTLYPLFAALCLALLLWQRPLLRRTEVKLAILAASLGLLPYLLWNAGHDWASLRWTWQHFTVGTGLAKGPMAKAGHIASYLSPPFVLLCLPGFCMWRDPRARWLALIALLLLVPILLSPVDSPRNLLLGCLPLLLATSAWLSAPGVFSRARRILCGLLLATVALYGIGTTLAVVQDTRLPRSGATRLIREEAAGWRGLGARIRPFEGLVFAVDYQIASQLWFYSGRPVYTGWTQYKLWGIPDFTNVIVINLEHVPEGFISERMARMFRQVEGPERVCLSDNGISKAVRLWRGSGLLADKEVFLSSLDFSALYRLGSDWVPRKAP
jgi:4-amino-4-deoxy-L-arabinose transferase-like glycosyltransferase